MILFEYTRFLNDMRRKLNSFWNLKIIKPENYYYSRKLNTWSLKPDLKNGCSSYRHFRSGEKCAKKAIALVNKNYTVVVYHYFYYKSKKLCDVYVY